MSHTAQCRFPQGHLESGADVVQRLDLRVARPEMDAEDAARLAVVGQRLLHAAEGFRQGAQLLQQVRHLFDRRMMSEWLGARGWVSKGGSEILNA